MAPRLPVAHRASRVMTGQITYEAHCTSCGHTTDCPCECCWPKYVPTPVAACPRCLGNCVDEGLGYWCPSCRIPLSTAEVAFFEEDNDD